MNGKYIHPSLIRVQSRRERFLCRCYLLFLFGAIFITAPSLAEEDSFDGSDFNPESFRDMNFGKQIYGELPYKSVRSQKAYRDDRDLTTFEKDRSAEFDYDKDTDLRRRDSDNKRRDDRDDDSASRGDAFGAVPTLVKDWVPSEPDLTSNGGFSIAPDNGSPVPYNLNGHVDIQR